jgi:hypothetical protein
MSCSRFCWSSIQNVLSACLKYPDWYFVDSCKWTRNEILLCPGMCTVYFVRHFCFHIQDIKDFYHTSLWFIAEKQQLVPQISPNTEGVIRAIMSVLTSLCRGESWHLFSETRNMRLHKITRARCDRVAVKRGLVTAEVTAVWRQFLQETSESS